jgi:ATP-dependent protease HslVU (ClpYQ) peptidase subunit
MSIVVAVARDDRVVMAADTLTSFGHETSTPDNQRTTKIRRVGDSLLGRAGWGVYNNILDEVLDEEKPPALGNASSIFAFFNELWRTLHKRYAFVNDQAKRKDSPFGDLGGSFLIANRSGIFYVAPNLGVSTFKKHFAIGTGADYSLGALHQLESRDGDAGSMARAAVETAIALNLNCGGEIDLLEAP